jgi:exopolysaccharide biosynthesis polyprenyl glycosylphosphotransferase
MIETPEMGDRRRMRAPGPRDGRVLIVGARRQGRRLARLLAQGPWTGLPIVGFVDAGHPSVSGPWRRGRQLPVHPRSEPVPVLGAVDQLAELVDRSGATHLVIALPGQSSREIEPQLADLGDANLRVHWVTKPSVSAKAFHHCDHPGWVVLDLPWRLRWGRIAKRLFDLVVSAVALIVLAPLFLAVSAAIWITSGRPIFYCQERVGQGGRIFRIWKFRSMRPDAEAVTGPIWASDHDERCTQIGDWLRHTNIDELPQLINVLLGEMSLVGPRPERPVFVDRFRAALPDYDLRHTVPTGMTGWAQVHGWRGRTSLRKRVQFDLDYIQRWSFWLDIQILFMTVQHVLWGKTTWAGTKRGPES